MNAKHTPGPWKVRNDNIVGGTHDNIIAEVRRYGAGLVEGDEVAPWHSAKENAALIAAAPELYEALRGLASTARTFRNVPKDEQEWTTLDDEALDAAFDAIAKAEGGQL